MLDYRQVLANPEQYRAALKSRGYDLPIENIEALSHQRRTLLRGIQEMRRQLKDGSQKIADIQHQLTESDEAPAPGLKQAMSKLRSHLKTKETQLRAVEAELEALMLSIPNIPSPQAPIGLIEQDNPVIRYVGTRPVFDFYPKTHHELGERMGVIDFARATKLAGPRFSVLKGALTRLEFALKNFLLDLAVLEHGYMPVSVPHMVTRKTITGTGQLPKYEDDLFRIKTEDREWFLIPTAEVSVNALHSGEILAEEALPITYCALTPCYRVEAGSAGRDAKGLIRQRQFEKVELVRICHPDNAWNELDIVTQHAETILQKLNLHYRVVTLCTGDLSFHVQFAYDLEAWLPGQNAYREIASCCYYGDYQARRCKIRYRADGERSSKLVHTVNGSGMPIGRTLIAIMEQYQQADGSICIPDVLREYTQFEVILPDGRVQ